MALSLVSGTAYEVHTTDEILDHPNVRPYRMGGAAYIGIDTLDISHVCGWDCAMRIIPQNHFRAESGDAYVAGVTYPSKHGITVRTVDILDFDPGDDPYVLCAACGAELLRDDEAFEAMYGRSINDPTV